MNVSWLILTTIAIIILVPLATLIGYLVYEHGKARANRGYKTLEDHSVLNAGSREDWMAGVLPAEDRKDLNRFTTIVAPLVQLATVVVLAIVVVVSNSATQEQSARQQDQISELESQIHALAFVNAASPATPRSDPDPAASIMPQSGAAGPSPMQVACANLIGRVADAYQQGESSKIALSLEELVKKLKCVNGMPP